MTKAWSPKGKYRAGVYGSLFMFEAQNWLDEATYRLNFNAYFD
jgi:hypothetical protein